MKPHAKRDAWNSKWGFILACIGSAVGMGNIWLFPSRISAYDSEIARPIPDLRCPDRLHRRDRGNGLWPGSALRSSGAFGLATRQRFGRQRPGRLLGLIPVCGSLAMAIGYSVVVGWIFKYFFHAIDGSLMSLQSVEGFTSFFNGTAAGNTGWQLLGLLITLAIMAFGIGRGIEKANQLMMPLFYLLFIGLVVYIATLPEAAAAYRYIFVLNPRGLLNPMVWVYALGQAFFSLSVAGNGTLIYGSYLSRDSNIPADAKMVAVFDTFAAMLAALVIIPAMAAAGQHLDQSGPGLMFIFLPNVLKSIPGGNILLIVFFLAVVFAALTSLVNLYESPVGHAGGALSPVPPGGCGCDRRHRHRHQPFDRSRCIPLDGHLLHLPLSFGRAAGGRVLLLALQTGLRAGTGQPGPESSAGRVVLPYGALCILRRHAPGADPGAVLGGLG